MDHQLDIHVDNGLHECIHFQLLVDDCLLEFYDLEHLHYHQLHQLDGVVDHTYHILHFYQEVHNGHQYLVLVHLQIHDVNLQHFHVAFQHFHDVTRQCFHVACLQIHVEYQQTHVAFQYFREVSQLIQLGQLGHLERLIDLHQS